MLIRVDAKLLKVKMPKWVVIKERNYRKNRGDMRYLPCDQLKSQNSNHQPFFNKSSNSTLGLPQVR